MKLYLLASLLLVLTSAPAQAKPALTDSQKAVGVSVSMGKFQLRTTTHLNLACVEIDATPKSTTDARMTLKRYLKGENVEKRPVASTRPTERVVDADFKGRLCQRIIYTGMPFPKPLESSGIKLTLDMGKRSVYVKRFRELIEPKKVKERAEQLIKLLKEKNIDDADLSKRYIFNYMPDLYELGFLKK